MGQSDGIGRDEEEMGKKGPRAVCLFYIKLEVMNRVTILFSGHTAHLGSAMNN